MQRRHPCDGIQCPWSVGSECVLPDAGLVEHRVDRRTQHWRIALAREWIGMGVPVGICLRGRMHLL